MEALPTLLINDSRGAKNASRRAEDFIKFRSRIVLRHFRYISFTCRNTDNPESTVCPLVVELWL